MADLSCPLRFSYIVFVVCILSLGANSHAADEERKVHIVYMGGIHEGKTSSSSYHTSMLQNVVGSNFVGQSLVRSYTRSFNAFAAYLTEEERQKLANSDEVISVFPSRTLQTQTTGSWNFMGFSENVHRNPAIESDVIIGVIDTGIWPKSESFSDQGLGPVPEKWKGECQGGKNFTCNRKIIGARFYNSNENPDNDAFDIVGHGTHTASTAAGNNVKHASFFGIASGTARGGVPLARLAAYKVCYPSGCSEADILAGFDDAIADGVDIITISVGAANAIDLKNDAIAIGAFHALDKGILTVNSAGNNGFEIGQVASVAPWLFTVAASTTNRRIISNVILGNRKKIIGNAVNAFKPKRTRYPLVYGKQVSRNCTEDDAQMCSQGCLDSDLVKGKIVVCTNTRGVTEAHRASAVGSIALTGRAEDVSFVFALPTTVLRPRDFQSVVDYINSTRVPRAKILRSKITRNLDAPVVASFSSKGPNMIIPEILKPDVTAPGVDILAAYSPKASVTEGDTKDPRSVEFNVLSGTSMSCPHTAGAAAYVKTLHPDWSPSAIKSALMTTAWRMNGTTNPEAEFAYGAGHIDPLKAVNPGLVYQTLKDDYIKMLCSMKYDSSTLQKIFGNNTATCPKGAEKLSPRGLNYPSMSFLAEKRDKHFSVKFSRSVTNVGIPNSTYKAKTTSPRQINITVEPDTLTFKALNETKQFSVTVTGVIVLNEGIVSASLEWFDGTYSVRSPITLYTSDIIES